MFSIDDEHIVLIRQISSHSALYSYGYFITLKRSTRYWHFVMGTTSHHSFDFFFFFELSMNNEYNKQSSCLCFETPRSKCYIAVILCSVKTVYRNRNWQGWSVHSVQINVHVIKYHIMLIPMASHALENRLLKQHTCLVQEIPGSNGATDPKKPVYLM